MLQLQRCQPPSVLRAASKVDVYCFKGAHQVGHEAPLSFSPILVTCFPSLRSLPLSEYTMLAQWLTSYKDTFPGWHGHRRRYVMERLWPVMPGKRVGAHGCTPGSADRPCVLLTQVVFGCDRDAHRYPDTYGEPAGCTEDMVFGSKEEHTGAELDLLSLSAWSCAEPFVCGLRRCRPHQQQAQLLHPASL